MPLTLYELSVPMFIKRMTILQSLLAAGVKHTTTSSTVTEQTLLDSSLIADMKPLTYQIQRVSDAVKGVAVRLGGIESEVWADDEKTFPELQARLEKSITILKKLNGKFEDNVEEKEVDVMGQKLNARVYLLDFVIPNFFFHVVTAYGLLRKEGVPIGKMDYLFGAGGDWASAKAE